MKTLINKQNPEIRITAPDITLENHCYCIWTDDGYCVIEFWEKDWTFVEEEPKRKQSPALKKIMDNLSEEKLSKTRVEMKLEDAAEPLDLEKELGNRVKSLEPYFEALDNYCTEKIMSLCDGTKVKPSLDIVDITDCIIDVARHFYELGKNSK